MKILLLVISLGLSFSTYAFGPQSSTKAQEWGFDFVETFDGLQDWSMNQHRGSGNNYDINNLARMPKLANGNTSAWGYFSVWDVDASSQPWIGGTEGGTRQVWRGTKSATIDIGETGHGPSRLGLLFSEAGYKDFSLFYMVWIPKNEFPTSYIDDGPAGAVEGLGVYTEGQPYVYYPSWKFNTFTMECNATNCPIDPPYGLHHAVPQIKQFNYTPNGLFIQNENSANNEVGRAHDAGAFVLNPSMGQWMGVEFRINNNSTDTGYTMDIWHYDQSGNSTHIMQGQTFTIEAPAHGGSWDLFWFGGNNANGYDWGPTMQSAYYVDDFIVDDGSKGRIGPRYFAAINTSTPTTPTPAPVLNFSDLISGPDTGLGDGLGSGAIVTVWGQHLGSSQGSSTIEFCDSTTVCRPGHVYYWKNADGVAPSGPANLHESHGMQEIAFSIPDSAMGAGTIRVTTAGGVSTLPFTVRAGSIFHVKPTGSDSNPGTFAQPWLTAMKVGQVSGGAAAPAGSTTYFHGTTSGTALSDARGIYFNNAAASSGDPISNFFYTTYPGPHSTALGREGFTHYQVSGAAMSKFRLGTSNCIELANGQRTGCTSITPGTWGARTDRWGRIIANYFYEPDGTCSSAQQGAINGDANFEDNVTSAKILGNEIEGHGCQSSNAQHHTTYLSIRSDPDDLQIAPWEWGWNYLHDNWAKSGIHQFDQNTGCGDLTGPLMIHNNVIVNQGGPGIYVGGQCGWSMDAYIENNVIINAGLPTSWDGVNPATTLQWEPGGVVIRDSGMPPTGGLLGTMYIRNNTIHNVGPSGSGLNNDGCLTLTGSGDSVSIVFTDNVCVNPRDYGFITASGQSTQQLNNITGTRNIFRYAGSGTPVRAIVPGWATETVTIDPQVTITGARIAIAQTSPALEKSLTALSYDIYGIPRTPPSSLGAVEYAIPANTSEIFPSIPLNLNGAFRQQ